MTVAVVAGMAWAILQGLWFLAGGILVVALVLGWFGNKKLRR